MASPLRRLEMPDKNSLAAIYTPPRTSVFARMFRILIALPLLALSAWVLLPFTVVPVSIVAVTNARISQVRSQGAGQVQRFYVEVGDHVKVGQPLVDIASSASDLKNTAEDLRKKKSDAEIQNTALAAQIDETQRRLRGYDQDVHEYTSRMITETELRLRQANRELDADRAAVQQLKGASTFTPKNEELVEIDREIGRTENHLAELRQRYSETYPDIQQVQRELDALQARRTVIAKAPVAPPQPVGVEQQAALAKEIESKSELVERLKAQLANLQSGYFVGPEQEHPPSMALRDEAAAALGKLKEQRMIASLQEKAADGQLATVVATPADSVTTIRSMVDGVVWSRDIPGGQTARVGEDLIRLAESDSIQVEAYLDSRYAQRLSIGDRALVFLTSENKSVRGRLVSIQAPAQHKAESENYAIDLKPPVEGLHRVMVQIDPADRQTARVGQVARVLFPGPDGSFLSKIYSWMNRF
jgi:multidrug resistance efflux pump